MLWCAWLPLDLRQWDALSTFRVGLFSSANTLTGMPRVCLLGDGDSNPDTLTLDHIPRNRMGAGLKEAHQALNRVGSQRSRLCYC